MQEKHHILLKYWGYQNFRPLQEEIINSSLEKKDVLALLPTGGGKSLCFQIPGLLKDGICLVISPLIALMEDQVKTLQDKGIKALSLTGGISFQELDSLLDNCIYGNYKFLYLSPERLLQDIVQQRIKQMNVNLIAVDEAHCISQWGHDFRPAYLNIALLRDLHPDVPYIALTASATKEVVKDIQEQLKFKNAQVFQGSLDRPNLAFKVVFAEDKMYRLRQILNNREETSIIYVRSRNATVEITKELQYYGYKAAAFHGGLSGKEKTQKLNNWFKEKVKIMVATNAFGMGIDKANVRHVVHLNLPESIESYFQEAGRAGRDMEPATATIITNKSDLPLLKNQFLKTLPDLEFTILVYKKLTAYFRIAFGEGEECNFDFNFSDFCNHYQLPSEKVYNTLQLLDRISILKMSQQFRKKSFLQFIISNRQLFPYLEENPQFEPIVKAILRTYGGIFENKMPINLHLVTTKAEKNEKEVLKVLKRLHSDKIIDFEYQQNDASITFLVPREDEKTIYPFSRYINDQARKKREKIGSLLDYIDNTTHCRRNQLVGYFGEKAGEPCGVCSVCQPADKDLKKETIKRIYMNIISELESGHKSSRELVEKLPFPESGILKVLELLLEKEIIEFTVTNRYKLKHV